MSFTPRPSQQQILRYNGGRLGIAAVPGAGKTHILSALAAKLIQEGRLGDDQEVLIVTLVNSAVDNFETRIKRFFDNPLQALFKYRYPFILEDEEQDSSMTQERILSLLSSDVSTSPAGRGRPERSGEGDATPSLALSEWIGWWWEGKK